MAADFLISHFERTSCVLFFMVEDSSLLGFTTCMLYVHFMIMIVAEWRILFRAGL